MSETEAAARQAIAAFLGKSEAQIGWEAPLTDAVTDSFILVDLAIRLQQDFAVRFEHEDLVRVKTPTDLAALVRDKKAASAPP